MLYYKRIKKGGLLFSIKSTGSFVTREKPFEIIVSWGGIPKLADLIWDGGTFVDIAGKYSRTFYYANEELVQKYTDTKASKEVSVVSKIPENTKKEILQILDTIVKNHCIEIDVEKKQTKNKNISKGVKEFKSIKSVKEKPVLTTPEIKEEPKPVEESHNTNTDDHLGRRPIERIAEGTSTQPYAGKVPKEIRDFARSIFPHAVESSEAERQRKTQEAIRQEMHEAIMNDDDIPY